MQRQRIVISGASGGIGAALAQTLAGPQVELLLLARRSEALRQVAECCRARGASVVWHVVDLRDPAAVSTCVTAFAQGGGVQLLIANAGVVALEARPDEGGPHWEQLWAQIHDNLNSTLSLLQAVLTLPLKERSPLHCVVVSSLNAFLAVGEAPGYCVAKAGQKALMEALEDFYACRSQPSSRIRFTTVFPGFVATGMALNYPGYRPLECSPEQAARRIVRGIRAGRRRIIFPRRLALLLWIGECLPGPVRRWCIRGQRAFTGSSAQSHDA